MIKQPGSKMCFVCGVDNSIGLHLDFWMEGDQVWTDFTAQEQHQGWPGILHGGLIATLLDETMGRAAFLKNLWMVSIKIDITYRKPVPIGQPLRVAAQIDDLRGSRMQTSGRILLPDGALAVEARGLYIRIPESQKEMLANALIAQGVDASEWSGIADPTGSTNLPGLSQRL